MMTLMLCAAFIVWIVRRPHAPEVTLQGMEFQRLGIGAGSDATGVPTEVINLESRVDMTFRNPSKYFKMFSSPINLQLSYLGVPIASGRVPEFLTDAKAGRPLRVRVKSVLIPLYGAGPILEALREDQSTVRLTLTGSIDSHVNLVGQFLTRHFTETIHCDIVLNLGNLHVISSDCFPCS
ncbi:hypothetical protein O6H91_Y098700 [Diphasiastrum complanatum]|nr:hypothetical protein O6H91_Y098700 [Diphasiastrum complanatum]